MHSMNELRNKTVNVLKSLDAYYQDLGGNENHAIAQEIQTRIDNIPRKCLADLLEIVEKYREQLLSLKIIHSKIEYEREILLLDRLISILRMNNLLEMLKKYGDDEDEDGLEATDEDEDGLEATLEKYAKDDDVYVQ